MKGKIDKGGALHLNRSGKMKMMACRFSTGPSGDSNGFDLSSIACGDYCPHFGEPAEVEDGVYSRILHQDGTTEELRRVKIEICHGKTIIIDNFTDERTFDVIDHMKLGVKKHETSK